MLSSTSVFPELITAHQFMTTEQMIGQRIWKQWLQFWTFRSKAVCKLGKRVTCHAMIVRLFLQNQYAPSSHAVRDSPSK